MDSTDDSHHCPGRERAEALQAEVEDLKARLAAVERILHGKKGEGMPSKDKALNKGQPSKRNGPDAQQKRKTNGETRAGLPDRTIDHPVPPEACSCPQCGGVADRPVGDGRVTTIYEYIPPRFERQRHVQQTLACRCGEHVVTAPAPPKVADKAQYGPGLVAQIVVSRAADSIPLYRQEKQVARLGIPMNRSTMCGLYHRAAELVTPIYACVLEEIARERVVQADETPLKMHGNGSGDSRPGCMWTFLDADRVAYVYSPGRSGDVPVAVLGGTSGVRVVDAYSGDNAVCTPSSRTRAGCLARVRRKFFEARSSAETAADEAMTLILEVYRIEARARKQGILRTPAHLQLRQTEGRAAMDRFNAWLLEQQGRWPPKGAMGKAIAYALNQWDALCVFLDDVRVPPDNNLSENALRIIALGRKNWQLVGHEEAGQNTAVLHTLVACCNLAGVNPQEYLADVLIRVQTHPASEVAALPPKQWKTA
jgi:transposase